METFAGRTAIVTGGGSGIGLALCGELARRGADVTVADIRAEAAQKAAAELADARGRARGACADVSREEAVRALVAEVVGEHGRLDYMFNNAGVAVAGEERDVTLEQWRRIVEVDLWGVVYGTRAAYEQMVRQGSGHIINTASAAGLMPIPMGAAYAAAKHAVVGLSLSLRAEAADLGVRVSVVCPGAVQTPIFDTTPVLHVDGKELMARAPFRPMDVTRAARLILRGVARNRGIIVFPLHARLPWWLYRLCPALMEPLSRLSAREFRSLRRV